jgi:hypothetical protein
VEEFHCLIFNEVFFIQQKIILIINKLKQNVPNWSYISHGSYMDGNQRILSVIQLLVFEKNDLVILHGISHVSSGFLRVVSISILYFVSLKWILLSGDEPIYFCECVLVFTP